MHSLLLNEYIRNSLSTFPKHPHHSSILHVWRCSLRTPLIDPPLSYIPIIIFSTPNRVQKANQSRRRPIQIKNKLQTHEIVPKTIRSFASKITNIATNGVPNVTEPNSQRANFSPFTKDYRELGLSMWIHNFSNPSSLGSSLNQKKHQQYYPPLLVIRCVHFHYIDVIFVVVYRLCLLPYVGGNKYWSQFQQQNMHMQKYIDDCVKSEAKNLMSLQGLLDVYDRENKYLNRQVLELLEENISLKKYRNRESLVTRQNYHLLQKENGEKGESYARGSSKKLVEKYKVGEDTPQRAVVQKRDEGVQVSEFGTQANDLKIHLKKEEITICKDPYLNEKDAVLFSFGPDTGRKEDTKNSTAQGGDLHLNQTLKKSNHYKVVSPEKQQKEIVKSPEILKVKQQSPVKEQIKSLDSVQDADQKTQPKKPNILNKSPQKKREESQARDRRTNKSQHAIKPSPQLTPSNRSSKHLNTPCPSEKHLSFNQSFEKLRKYESIDRKKKFIDILSSKLTPTRMMKVQDGDCC